MVKNEFFLNNSKNIDIWILRKELNLIRSEFYMCVPSLVKMDWEMPVKNPRWPPRNFFFFVFSTSVRGDFPRIIEIALYFFILFIYYIFSNADFFSILNVFQSYLNLRYPIENLFIVSSRIRIQNLTIIIGRWHSNQLSHSALLIIEISITVVFDYKKWSLLYNSLLNTSLLYNRLLNNSVLLNCLLHVQAVPIKMTTFVFSIITKWPVVRLKRFAYKKKTAIFLL